VSIAGRNFPVESQHVRPSSVPLVSRHDPKHAYVSQPLEKSSTVGAYQTYTVVYPWRVQSGKLLANLSEFGVPREVGRTF